ncbi:unnamed protein product [Amaranthus hypochondriacus]
MVLWLLGVEIWCLLMGFWSLRSRFIGVLILVLRFGFVDGVSILFSSRSLIPCKFSLDLEYGGVRSGNGCRGWSWECEGLRSPWCFLRFACGVFKVGFWGPLFWVCRSLVFLEFRVLDGWGSSWSFFSTSSVWGTAGIWRGAH